jgi:hypothetical protein
MSTMTRSQDQLPRQMIMNLSQDQLDIFIASGAQASERSPMAAPPMHVYHFTYVTVTLGE